MKYHIIASKTIKECKCSKGCRAKFGQFNELDDAKTSLRELVGPDKKLTFDNKPIDVDVETNSTAEKNNAITVPVPEDDEILEWYDDDDLNILDEDNLDIELAAIKRESKKRRKPNNSSEDYFSDDEEFLQGDDVVDTVNENSALIYQMENIVSWRIENFYDDDGRPRGRFSLRSSPPVLRIESSDGSSAEFVVTQNLSAQFADAFTNIRRAYYGAPPKKKSSLNTEQEEPNPDEASLVQNKMIRLIMWGGDNPYKSVTLFLLIAVLITVLFVQ